MKISHRITHFLKQPPKIFWCLLGLQNDNIGQKWTNNKIIEDDFLEKLSAPATTNKPAQVGTEFQGSKLTIILEVTLEPLFLIL